MKRHGLENLPLWNTETGIETLNKGDPYSPLAAYTHTEAMARLSQLIILGAASGLEQFDFCY